MRLPHTTPSESCESRNSPTCPRRARTSLECTSRSYRRARWSPAGREARPGGDPDFKATGAGRGDTKATVPSAVRQPLCRPWGHREAPDEACEDSTAALRKTSRWQGLTADATATWCCGWWAIPAGTLRQSSHNAWYTVLRPSTQCQAGP
ncbi:hypothetical protein MUG91_G20n102 [Manis pentadactyla]|nr:hypothetical protein MUG91_G20n102 [Manis pentadactyla]